MKVHKRHRAFAILILVLALFASAWCSAAMAHAQGPAPSPQPQPTVDLPIIPYPTAVPDPTQPPPAGLPNPVQIIQNWINARIWFPAETFIQAITEATEAIFTAQLEAIKEPMKNVLGFILFGGVAIFGNASLPDQVTRLGEYMVAAAVPLWALSLAIMGLSVLTRNAANMGYATNDLALEGVRWGLICMASGNGLVIVNLVHSGFNALNGAVASIGQGSAGEIVDLLLPASLSGGVPLLVLVLGILIAFITMLILTVTYAARYIMLLGIAGLAPLAIATEGLPFARIVFRDWTGMFLKVELLGVLNTFILVLIAVIAEAAASATGPGGMISALISIILMLGLSSAIIGVNLSVFQDIFGLAMNMANQAVSALAFAATFLASGGASALGLGEGMFTMAGAGHLASGLGQSLDSPVLRSTGRGLITGAHSATDASGASEAAAWERAWQRGTEEQVNTDGEGNSRTSGRIAVQQRQAAQRAEEALAQKMGARWDGEREQVSRARDALAVTWGRDHADRAMHEAAPVVRAMVDAAGGADAAARESGFENFGQLAQTVGTHYATRNGHAPESPQATSTTRDWLQQTPARDASRLTRWDVGAGVEIADALKLPSVEAPRYARMVQHIRSRAGVDSAREAVDLARDIGTGVPDATNAELKDAFHAALSSRLGVFDGTDVTERRTP
jgi:hypothetical protein